MTNQVMTKELVHLVDDALSPARFYVGRGMRLEWMLPAEETISWEIFRGRLLEPTQTREKGSFLSWHVHALEEGGRSAEPLISVKLDREHGEVHVVRGILCHVWEGYSEGNTILSREATRWVRELVGTLRLSEITDAAEQSSELRCLIEHAVVGISRLPLTSIEAPLPAFALGKLAYLPCPHGNDATSPTGTWQEMASRLLELDSRSLEALLRAVDTAEVPQLTACVTSRWRPEEGFGPLLRDVFRNVSLSPYTSFVDNALAFARTAAGGACNHLDFLRDLLIQVHRHLTAYDLVTFHHRGANYPDALLLDAALGEYLQAVEAHAEWLHGDDRNAVLRRRALRQGLLLRRHYEGLPVPDAPTSPGENARVLPAPHRRVPEEQMVKVLRRQRMLFPDAPTRGLLSVEVRTLLAHSITDLARPAEACEMGTAVFVDRPFGWFKAPGEVDRTPLLAHLAVSPSVARRRFQDLVRFAEELAIDVPAETRSAFERGLVVDGVPIAEVADPPFPVISLADARRVAADFVVRRTLPRAWREAFAWPGNRSFAEGDGFMDPQRGRVLLRIRDETARSVLAVFDSQYRRRAEIEWDLAKGLTVRHNREWPAAGIQVTWVNPVNS